MKFKLKFESEIKIKIEIGTQFYRKEDPLRIYEIVKELTNNTLLTEFVGQKYFKKIFVFVIVGQKHI